MKGLISEREIALEEAAQVAEARKPLYAELQAKNACAEIASSIRSLPFRSAPEHTTAVRELALEEAARAAENAMLEYNLSECAGLADWAAFEAGQESGLVHAAAAIRALCSPNHAENARQAVLEEGDLQELLERLDAGLEYEGELETENDHIELFNVEAAQDLFADAAAVIRSLSFPDHADVGKVEGELTAAARDVLAERRRQIEAEGWTPGHDDEHSSGQLAYAASVYALCAASPDADRAVMDEYGSYVSVPFRIRNKWPFDGSWLKPTNRRRDLVKAGAFILAEIERLDRLPSAPASEGAE